MKNFFTRYLCQSCPIILVFGTLLSLSGTQDPDIFFRSVDGSWVDDGHYFVLKRSLATFELINNKNLVMVSFKPYSRFAKNLRNYRNTLAYYSNASPAVGRALVSVNDSKERDELAAAAHEDIDLCGAIEDYNPNFRLTDLPDAKSPKIATTVKSNSVESLLNQISANNIQATVQTLQALGSRYHAGSNPNEAPNLIQTLWQSNAPSSASITQISHLANKDTNQKSVVLTIPAAGITTDETVIIGAHLDSINRSDQTQAPGADDNATGIAALTEILRIIKASNATFSRNIEIHAYGAEEVGLLGSADIASSYQSAGKTITAMLQMDMIGYSVTPSDTKVHIIKTHTSPVLVRHLKDLASVYLNHSWEEGTLAAGTSDHKSWTLNGYHAAFAFEHPVNHNLNIHSAEDTLDILDFNLASQFTKLALAFISHEAGLSTAITDTESAWVSSQATSDQIKVAVFKSSTNGYRIAASVSEELKATSFEVCKVSSGSEYGCQSLNTNAAKISNKLSRDFFATESDLEVADGNLWRINAYDSNGILAAMRSVKFTKK